MARKNDTVAKQRNYAVINVSCAKQIGRDWLKTQRLEKAVEFGLPEVDDRYHVWRVPFLRAGTEERIGELVIDARSSLILADKSSSMEALEARLLGRPEPSKTKSRRPKMEKYRLSCLRNIIALGDAEKVLDELPAECVNLVFTSPPYFNARPQYNDYSGYDAYLNKMRRVIRSVHRVLSEGRFFVMNVSAVLVRRSKRSEASKRIAVPFDMHRLFIEEGYDFIDDIIWVKPEGAGWATGRGRRFAADRNPLQYKAVPVTEYVLVYRKRTSRLIDWNIRAHPNPTLVKESRIGDDYECTNIWKIHPAHSKEHPAVFPAELAERVIRYYSFKEDVVLDPFAGIGTVGGAAVRLGRRFVLIEKEKGYVKAIRQDAVNWLGKTAKDIMTINCEPIVETGTLI